MRELRWEGCLNVRDLGGVPLRGGGATAFGAVVRGDAPRPDGAGLRAAREYGVRTVVDLRNDFERESVARADGVEVVHVPLDGIEHHDFWEAWEGDPGFGSPLYYAPFLERFSERAAAAVAAVAGAAPGGVLVHCVRGRDRTGLVSVLLLALAGAEPEAIAEDYMLSIGRDEEDAVVERHLASQGTSARELILGLLRDLDVERCVRAGGLTRAEVAGVRARLRGDSG